MGNPYPAAFIDGSGTERFGGEVDFTDAGNQPGGGLPAGITSPADGDLAFAPTDNSAPVIRADTAAGSEAAGSTVIKLVNDQGDDFFEVDADGTALIKLRQSFSTFTVNDSAGGVSGMLNVQSGGLLGFYGANPVTKPVVPMTVPTVQNVIDALVALGLVSQHD